MTDKGEILLNAIYDEVDHRLNPNDDECWYCNGEGETHDCFDGCCINADYGCPDCTIPCPECRLYQRQRAKAVREEVIKNDDLDIAVAWLKSVGRWREGITSDQVRQELTAAKEKLAAEAKETP